MKTPEQRSNAERTLAYLNGQRLMLGVAWPIYSRGTGKFWVLQDGYPYSDGPFDTLIQACDWAREVNRMRAAT